MPAFTASAERSRGILEASHTPETGRLGSAQRQMAQHRPQNKFSIRWPTYLISFLSASMPHIHTYTHAHALECAGSIDCQKGWFQGDAILHLCAEKNKKIATALESMPHIHTYIHARMHLSAPDR